MDPALHSRRLFWPLYRAWVRLTFCRGLEISSESPPSPHLVGLASFAVPYLRCVAVMEKTVFVSQISCYIFAIRQSLTVFVLFATSISREWLSKSEGPRSQPMRLADSPKTVLFEDLSVGKVVQQYHVRQSYYLYPLNLHMLQYYKIILIGSVFNVTFNLILFFSL